MRGCPVCSVRRWWRACATCDQRRCRRQHTMQEIMAAVWRYVGESHGKTTRVLGSSGVTKTTG